MHGLGVQLRGRFAPSWRQRAICSARPTPLRPSQPAGGAVVHQPGHCLRATAGEPPPPEAGATAATGVAEQEQHPSTSSVEGASTRLPVIYSRFKTVRHACVCALLWL